MLVCHLRGKESFSHLREVKAELESSKEVRDGDAHESCDLRLDDDDLAFRLERTRELLLAIDAKTKSEVNVRIKERTDMLKEFLFLNTQGAIDVAEKGDEY
jgi:hypothetical protein